jgi:hypothetical protein
MPNSIEHEYIMEYLDDMAYRAEKNLNAIGDRLTLIWDSYDAKTLEADKAITMLENLSERVDLIQYDLELETEEHTTKDTDDALRSCEILLDDIESLIDLISKN